MTIYNPGDVVLLPFPFTNLKTTKKRPALVLNSVPSKKLPTLLTVAMITSQVDGEQIQGDCMLTQWKEAGLIQTSKVRLAKLVSIESDMVLKKIGSLAPQDKEAIRNELKEIFSEF